MTATCSVQWTVGGSTPRTTEFTKTDEGIARLDVEDLAAPQTNKEYDVAIDVSQIKFVIIQADRDCTIKTNDSATPDDTLSIKADEPLLWWVNAPWTCPLTVDVADIFVTVGAGDNLNLYLAALVDPTP